MATQLLEQFQTAIGPAYHIERELGRGGMATVYLAEDRKHKRHVALKVLSPEFARAVGAERFLREIELAAQLQHPHILGLHDSGEAHGVLYYVMPYVDGETLRSRLLREAPLDPDEASRIACEVADALDYAHRRGIVHRDIKPENILLANGHAVVADFGIGKACDKRASLTLTQVGYTVGTPEYMSLEQAAGDTDLDGRSDIYSLGIVLYEMLGGRPPFAGGATGTLMLRRFTEPVPPLRSQRPAVSERLEYVVMRALAKDPAERWPTAGEFAQAITSAALRARPSPVERQRPSVAVLPFANMSADRENEFFSDGITEEILNALAQLPALHVAARTSSFAFKGQNVDLRTVGEQLGVATVLEGSVRRAGNRIRITAQLIDVDTGFHRWSDRYDRDLADVFAVQDEIANAIASELKVQLLGRTAEPAAAPSTDFETYELYLKARYFLNQHGPGLQQALELFQRVIERDPRYSSGWVGIAECYAVLVTANVMRPTEGYPRARSAALRAVALDAKDADARSVLGMIALLHDWDRERARLEITRALELDGNAVWSHMRMGLYHLSTGAWSDAIASMQAAVKVDPLALPARFCLAVAYHYAHRDDDVLAESERMIEQNPSYYESYWVLSMTLLRAGHVEDAIAAATRAVDLSHRNPNAVFALASAYASAKRSQLAKSLLGEMERRAAAGEFIPQIWAANVHLLLGDRDRALDALELAVLHREFWVITLPVDEGWAAIREHPRFRALIDRAGVGLDSTAKNVKT